MSDSEEAILDRITQRKGDLLQEELVRHETELDDAMASLFAAVRFGVVDTRRSLDRVLQACYNIPVLAMRMAAAYQPDLSQDISEAPIRPIPSVPHLENLLAVLDERLKQWINAAPATTHRNRAVHHLSGLTRGLHWLLEEGGGGYGEAPGPAGVRDEGTAGDGLGDTAGAPYPSPRAG